MDISFLAAVILFLLASALVAWYLASYKRLSVILKFLLITPFILGFAIAQDEIEEGLFVDDLTGIEVTEDDKPLILNPDILTKSAEAINNAVESVIKLPEIIPDGLSQELQIQEKNRVFLLDNTLNFTPRNNTTELIVV